jgi:hypothetical protein
VDWVLYWADIAFPSALNSDGFVKSPDAALRFILPLLSQGQAYCGVRQSTPHSSGFTRLACGLFTKPPHFHDF